MVTFDTERCKGCKLCKEACPKKIISMSETKINQKGYNVAEIADMSACISCGFCAVMCPDAAIEIA